MVTVNDILVGDQAGGWNAPWVAEMVQLAGSNSLSREQRQALRAPRRAPGNRGGSFGKRRDGRPSDAALWDRYVARMQDNGDDGFMGGVGDFIASPMGTLAALGGFGGMTLANTLTGEDVGEGVITDVAGLAAGAGLSAVLPATGLSTTVGSAGVGATGGVGSQGAVGTGGEMDFLSDFVDFGDFGEVGDLGFGDFDWGSLGLDELGGAEGLGGFDWSSLGLEGLGGAEGLGGGGFDLLGMLKSGGGNLLKLLNMSGLLGGAGGAGGKGGMLNLLQGGSSLLLGNKMLDTAREAADRADPFRDRRGQYKDRLDQVMTNPSSIFQTPGWEAGLEAVNRGMAKGGYLGSGNQMIALQKYGGDFYNNEVNRLMTMAGANVNPGAGAQLLMQGTGAAADMLAGGAGQIAYGARGV